VPENAFRRLVSLRAETHRPIARVPVIGKLVLPRTDSPSLCSCPASGGASSFLPASALLPPPDLATDQRTRRAMRLIDFCHPYDLRVPAPRAFPARYRDFRRVDTPQSLGSARFDRRIERFTAPEPLWRIDNRTRYLELRLPALRERGRNSSHGAHCDRASDIPVASPSCRHDGRAFARASNVEGAAEAAVTNDS
jgi:hypothetical protein